MKKYIRESFFNPILHLLPILIFLVLEDVLGNTVAWVFSFPIALLILGYVLIFYKSIYRWHLLSTAVYLSIAVVVTLFDSKFLPVPFEVVFGELVAATFMFVLVFFRKFFFKLAVSMTSKKMGMQNNLNELVRTANVFIIIFLSFVVIYLLGFYFVQDQLHYTLVFLYQLYVVSLILAVIYEFIRVFAIRGHLLKEEWLPIVNEKGQEIGSIQRQESLSEPKNHIHPVVRVIIIEGNRIFLRRNSCKNDVNISKWDNALYSHIRLKESAEDCIRRASQQLYGVANIHPIALSNYLIDNAQERQFVHLFVSCRLHDIQTNPEYSNAVKWWTMQQINEELESGIFTDCFLKEYALLQRSGLIDAGKCSCECALRDEIESRA